MLLYEPHKQKRNEFVYIPSYIAFHTERGEVDDEDIDEVVSFKEKTAMGLILACLFNFIVGDSTLACSQWRQ